MPAYRISWSDIAFQAYEALPVDRQDAVDTRLRQLADGPTADARLDPSTGWWTTTYADHDGLLMFGISELRRHIVILRLQDLG